MPRITLAQLKALASAHGFTVRKTDGEYRVAPCRSRDPQWCEDRAYYTDDAQDAMDTLRAMIEHGATEGSTLAKQAQEDHATCTYPAWLDDAG